MAQRKIKETRENGGFLAKVYRDSDYGEYRVALWHNGAKVENADYFTTDKADALATAESMVSDAARKAGTAGQRPAIEILYASGETGDSVRANGNGGTLARGWYVKTADGTAGPFAKKTDARIVAELAAVEIDGLRWNRETKTHDDIKLNPSIFADADGAAIAIVSAEDGKGFADYYGEFRGGYPWIAETLETFATARGLIWEWQNPGAIGLYHS